MSSSDRLPAGFRCVTRNMGVKDDADDFAFVYSERPTTSAAVFTQSTFAGPSVTISRVVQSRGDARGMVVIARNANVATGPEGLANAEEVRASVAAIAGVDPEQIVIASTGVIGQPYPMDKIRDGLAQTRPVIAPADFAAAASAMMTTDTHPKIATASVGVASITGIAKGVGMIEPNMATMLAFFFTDAVIEADALDALFRRVMELTFNAVSIDTDTSTSDTAAIFANGAAGPVDLAVFEAALYEVALTLVKMIASDGEGATKLITVEVSGSETEQQAKIVAKSIVNSPLVKTAMHGADPNWGRVAMAIGKVPLPQLVPDRVRIAYGDLEMYPCVGASADLATASEYLRGDDVRIAVDLALGSASFTVYGCDLTEGYVRINADYTS